MSSSVFWFCTTYNISSNKKSVTSLRNEHKINVIFEGKNGNAKKQISTHLQSFCYKMKNL